ncbi:MAG TPA: hypothetical protein P5539_13160 [Mesotoga sp.]|nr:hypothetical protein [Mesotoga sp.]
MPQAVITPSDAHIFMYRADAMATPVYMDTVASITVSRDASARPVFNLGTQEVDGFTFGSNVVVGNIVFYKTTEYPFAKVLSQISDSQIGNLVYYKRLSDIEQVHYITSLDTIPAEKTVPFSIIIIYRAEILESRVPMDILDEMKIVSSRQELDHNSTPIVIYDFVARRLRHSYARVSTDSQNGTIEIDASAIRFNKPRADWSREYEKIIRSGT